MKLEQGDLEFNYNRIVEWNAKCGTKLHTYNTKDWWKAVQLQSALLVEEAKESFDACEVFDPVELLDGAVDTFVILSYLIKQLDQAGFDFGMALEKVMDNNDTKIFDSYYEAVEARGMIEKAKDVECHIETSVVDGLPYYTVRNEVGKVQKPIDFVAVDITDCIPESD